MTKNKEFVTKEEYHHLIDVVKDMAKTLLEEKEKIQGITKYLEENRESIEDDKK